MNKAQLRLKLLAQRNLKPSVNTIINDILYQIIQQYQPKCIAAYMSIRQEVDILPTIELCKLQGIKVALPCIIKKDYPLIFRQWQLNKPLIQGMYNTFEPSIDSQLINISAIDLIIMPCVGIFCIKNSIYRLGYGGGFYDRTLANCNNKSNFLIKVGIYHDTIQSIIKLSPQEEKSISILHDIPLNMAITATGVIT